MHGHGAGRNGFFIRVCREALGLWAARERNSKVGPRCGLKLHYESGGGQSMNIWRLATRLMSNKGGEALRYGKSMIMFMSECRQKRDVVFMEKSKYLN